MSHLETFDIAIQRYVPLLRRAVKEKNSTMAIEAIDAIEREMSVLINSMRKPILTDRKFAEIIKIVNDFVGRISRLKSFLWNKKFVMAEKDLPLFESALMRTKTVIVLLYGGVGTSVVSQIYPALAKIPKEIPEEIQRINPQAGLVFSMLQASGGEGRIEDIAKETGLSVEQVEKIANLLVAGGYATMELDPTTKKILLRLKWEE